MRTRTEEKRKLNFANSGSYELMQHAVPKDWRYGEFIHGLSKANIELNRKVLSELAIHEPESFKELVAKAKAALEA